MKGHMILIVAVFSAIVLARGGFPDRAEAQTLQRSQSSSTTNTETIDVRYAKAFLELAQLDLQQALEAHEKDPGSTSDAAIETRQGTLALAKSQLDKVLREAGTDSAIDHIQKCEEPNGTAEAEYQNATAANRKSPASVSQSEPERLRPTAEVARLGLIKTSAADVNSTLQVLQWQLEELRSDVLSLRNRVEDLSQEK